MALLKWIGGALLFFMAGGAALANDTTVCGKGLVCATVPQTVVAAIVKAGHKAELAKDANGAPLIHSEANGYKYDIYFYGCTEGSLCDSLQFYISFDDVISNGQELANLWNTRKRFLQMAYEDGKYSRLSYDVATIGGITPENFADILAWWDSMLGEVPKFFEENARKPKK
ncbi:YbjN domain-containing protein [Sphingobium nicotianae]|uniref:YbjN domain-containing protein n=1 Tax=Sphingobium nicotianae TaxID=2782607 RepID=A0A9X1D816_9SPHN|nr:YbjN domain-containing protein [Sphingobium nicotianae]MBT2185747.1 YbjN domain-containing protein [Sphingobium nicotianae]